jgi:hypothetical protein
MSMLNTSSTNYRSSLPYVAALRKMLRENCGSFNPVGHYTEPRANGAMTKYYGIPRPTDEQLFALTATIMHFNKLIPGWKATAEIGMSNSEYRPVPQLKIHVNKTK